MPKKLACAQGHRWDPAIDRHRVASQRGHCPVCGDLPLAVATAEEAPHEEDVVAAVEVVNEPATVQPASLAGAINPVAPASVLTVTPAAAEPMAWGGVKLDPSLPMTVFTSTEPWQQERIGALALYCSDGRWGDAFDEFCHKRLLIPRYDRWAVPGGPAWLVPRDANRELYQAARQQLDFLVRVHELEQVVLITHYGCAYYAELLHKEPDALLSIQTEELHTAKSVLLEWFPQIHVETYLAMRRNNCLSFHQVTG